MFGRIIVATDLTPATRLSLRAACNLRRSDGEILLVHVIRRIPGLRSGEARRFYDRLKSDAGTRMLDLISWFVRERGVEIACLLATGDPAREMARIARDKDADLIVVSHGPGRAPLGSVSYKLTHVSPCAVLMLQGLARVDPRASAEVRGRRPARGAKRNTAAARGG